MKVGFVSDWTGAATLKIIVIDETISGKYICKEAPFEMMRPDGTKYMAEGISGLFLRDKKEVKVE